MGGVLIEIVILLALVAVVLVISRAAARSTLTLIVSLFLLCSLIGVGGALFWANARPRLALGSGHVIVPLPEQLQGRDEHWYDELNTPEVAQQIEDATLAAFPDVEWPEVGVAQHEIFYVNTAPAQATRALPALHVPCRMFWVHQGWQGSVRHMLEAEMPPALRDEWFERSQQLRAVVTEIVQSRFPAMLAKARRIDEGLAACREDLRATEALVGVTLPLIESDSVAPTVRLRQLEALRTFLSRLREPNVVALLAERRCRALWLTNEWEVDLEAQFARVNIHEPSRLEEMLGRLPLEADYARAAAARAALLAQAQKELGIDLSVSDSGPRVTVQQVERVLAALRDERVLAQDIWNVRIADKADLWNDHRDDWVVRVVRLDAKESVEEHIAFMLSQPDLTAATPRTAEYRQVMRWQAAIEEQTGVEVSYARWEEFQSLATTVEQLHGAVSGFPRERLQQLSHLVVGRGTLSIVGRWQVRKLPDPMQPAASVDEQAIRGILTAMQDYADANPTLPRQLEQLQAEIRGVFPGDPKVAAWRLPYTDAIPGFRRLRGALKKLQQQPTERAAQLLSRVTSVRLVPGDTWHGVVAGQLRVNHEQSVDEILAMMARGVDEDFRLGEHLTRALQKRGTPKVERQADGSMKTSTVVQPASAPTPEANQRSGADGQ